jgi:hypothetical protein
MRPDHRQVGEPTTRKKLHRRTPARRHVSHERLGPLQIEGSHAKRSQPGPLGRLPAVSGGRSDRAAWHEREDAEGDEGSLPAGLGAADPALGNHRGGDVPELAGRGEDRASPSGGGLERPNLQDAAGTAPHPQDPDLERGGRHYPGRPRRDAVGHRRGVPDGVLGAFNVSGRLVHDAGLQGGRFAYPFVRKLVRTELLDLGYYRRSHRFRVQPDCERIAALDQASTATVD